MENIIENFVSRKTEKEKKEDRERKQITPKQLFFLYGNFKTTELVKAQTR